MLSSESVPTRRMKWQISAAGQYPRGDRHGGSRHRSLPVRPRRRTTASGVPVAASCRRGGVVGGGDDEGDGLAGQEGARNSVAQTTEEHRGSG